MALSRYPTSQSEYNDLIGRQCPLSHQIHAPLLHTLDKTFRPEPAGRQAGASSRHLASPGQRPDHSPDVVVAIRCLLSLACTGNAIADQEKPHGYPRALTRFRPSRSAL